MSAVGIDPGPAEIRWNGPDGPLLGSGTGPNLSVSVKIPAVEPGLYQILVLSRGSGGVLSSSASSTFLVTGGGTGQNPSAAPARSTAGDKDPGGPGISVMAGGGAVLLALGAVAGIAVGRRRGRPSPVTSAA